MAFSFTRRFSNLFNIRIEGFVFPNYWVHGRTLHCTLLYMRRRFTALCLLLYGCHSNELLHANCCTWFVFPAEYDAIYESQGCSCWCGRGKELLVRKCVASQQTEDGSCSTVQTDPANCKGFPETKEGEECQTRKCC